jgi:hypothetical protein
LCFQKKLHFESSFLLTKKTTQKTSKRKTIENVYCIESYLKKRKVVVDKEKLPVKKRYFFDKELLSSSRTNMSNKRSS